MGDEKESESDKVSVSMEITGPYDDIMARLKYDQDERDVLDPFIHDVELVLSSIERMEEGTRSSIAENLPNEMSLDYDAEEVVNLLQVLKRYELVVLEGNTWKVSPKTRGRK